MIVGTLSRKLLKRDAMPRPKQWELFDKIFHPDAKRVEATEKPKPTRGARPMYVVIDELHGPENGEK